jgi:Major tropism determinant N-terminal domain
MAVRIQFRRGTAAEWAAANPTLAAGELGYESDTGQFKIGNGSANWASLSYGAVSESYVNDAIANVVGLSPETLDTLEELANAIGDDPNFVGTITEAYQDADNALSVSLTSDFQDADNVVTNNLTTAFTAAILTAVSDHSYLTQNVHGIADTAELETQTGAQAKADAAESAAQAYTDNAVANLIASAPSTLDTLNELAAALGDDPNFATTISTSLGTKLTFVADTAVNFTSANTVLALNTLAIETDTSKLKVGNGVTAWTALSYAAVTPTMLSAELANTLEDAKDYANTIVNPHTEATTAIHGISNTAELVYQSQIADFATTAEVTGDILTHNNTTTSVHGIADTSLLATTDDVSNSVNQAITDHQNEATPHGIDVNSLAYTDDVTNLISNAISDHASNTTNVHGIADTSALVTNSSLAAELADYAPKDAPTFTGEVVLPSSTTIGDVSSTELGYVNGVTSSIQTQLDSKLASSTASTTYAPIASPTFTGNVVLPSTTDIGTISSTEIGYLEGVTSSVQNQLDAKAPIESPAFTGTVSGITAAMVGLGNVDNTADLDKPVSNAVQTALDLKADLESPVFTGEVETSDLTVTGNLIVQGTTTTVSASDLKLRDNMIYLNQAGASVITNAVGDGTNVVYTTSEAHGYAAGDFVTVANVVPTSFNISGDGEEILAVTSNTFTVASTVTDTYTSGGTARGKVHFNPDLGWAAGRYADNTYAHAGMFRDATDGRFKFFDNYTPEPDESVFIDTSHASFSLAPIQVQNVFATGVTAGFMAFSDGTQQNTAGVPSLTQFTSVTSSFTLDSVSKKDGVYEVDSSSPVTITIPNNATLAWPIGASVDILQVGTGQVTISPAAGVTLNYTPGNKLRTQWSSCTIMKRGTDSWILYGDLTA